MARKWALAYINELLVNDDYMALVDLSQCLCSSPDFRSDHTEYGLPQIAFVFIEGLQWVAQSIRSGVSTYFESTSIQRQLAMKSALQNVAPPSFAQWYGLGMSAMKDDVRMDAVDQWLIENEDILISWLRDFVRQHQALVYELTA